MAKDGDARKPSTSLSFDMLEDTAQLLNDLMNAVRKAGHARPSQKVFVEALIHNAATDGRTLELELLVPYRTAHPQIDNSK